MNVYQEIVSARLMHSKYHQRDVAICVPPSLFEKFEEVFLGIIGDSTQQSLIIHNGDNYVELLKIEISGKSGPHFQTVTMINVHQADPRAVKEFKMLADGFRGKRPIAEYLEI